MRKTTLVQVAAATVLVLAACERSTTTAPLAPSAPTRITDGTLDGSAHPAVVLIIMDVDGSPASRCTGTLIAPKLVLTAGHCTGERGELSGMRVFTESDVENGNNNYPNPGPNTVEAKSWASHPLFTNAAFYLHDVGVIELKTAINLPASAYGRLPAVNQLDALKPRSSTKFTAVGYGVQRINPAHLDEALIRMSAVPHLLQINTGYTGIGSLLLSNNASTGGTCFGDSGGPNYLGATNVIAAVTSFAKNGTCGGTGGVFRMDRSDVLAFVGQYMK